MKYKSDVNIKISWKADENEINTVAEGCEAASEELLHHVDRVDGDFLFFGGSGRVGEVVDVDASRVEESASEIIAHLEEIQEARARRAARRAQQ